jgi:hypothetical protein
MTLHPLGGGGQSISHLTGAYDGLVARDHSWERCGMFEQLA